MNNKVINLAICHSNYKTRKKNKRRVYKELFYLKNNFYTRETFDIVNRINKSIIQNKRYCINNNKFYQAAFIIAMNNETKVDFKTLNSIIESCDGYEIEEAEVMNAICIN